MGISQTAIEAPRIAAANEPHLACVLLLDTSGSMSGAPIASLNQAINMFKEKTALDPMAMKRVDVAIIAFDDEARVAQEFTPISQMAPITLETGGLTSMGKGICFAIDKVKERNQFYASMGTPCFKPWIFMITDGAPTDDITLAVQRIRDEETKGGHGKLKFFALGVPGADMEVLKSISKRVLQLSDFDFAGIFNWMSESMVAISVSRVGAEAPMASQLPSNSQVVPSDW